MWIKIKNKSVNFDNVIQYNVSETKKREPFNGPETKEVQYSVWIETINETDEYGGERFRFDTLEEAKELVRKLDELLNVKEL
jgi:RPA family protein